MSKCLTSKWNELPEILYISSYIFNDLIWTCSPEELPKPNSKCNSNMHEHALQTYFNEVNCHSAKQLVFKWTSRMLRSPWGDMVMKTIWEETFYCNAFAFLQQYLGFAYKTMTFSHQGIVLMQKHQNTIFIPISWNFPHQLFWVYAKVNTKCWKMGLFTPRGTCRTRF